MAVSSSHGRLTNLWSPPDGFFKPILSQMVVHHSLGNLLVSVHHKRPYGRHGNSEHQGQYMYIKRFIMFDEGRLAMGSIYIYYNCITRILFMWGNFQDNGIYYYRLGIICLCIVLWCIMNYPCFSFTHTTTYVLVWASRLGCYGDTHHAVQLAHWVADLWSAQNVASCHPGFKKNIYIYNNRFIMREIYMQQSLIWCSCGKNVI